MTEVRADGNGQIDGHSAKPFVEVPSLLGERGQPAIIRQSTHYNHVVDGFAIELDVGDAQVHVGCKPSVQRHLAMAVVLAC